MSSAVIEPHVERTGGEGTGIDRGIAPIGTEGVVERRGPRCLRRARPTWVAFTTVALLAALLVGLHIRAYHPLSPFGEPQHVDYVHRILRGEIPASGDHWVPATTRATTCRTIDSRGTYVPPCGTTDPATVPNGGLTAAFHHPPLYYLVPAAAVALADAAGLTVDDIDVMRSTGILWLVGALALLWLLWRDFGVPWQARIGLSLALTAAPVVLLAQAAVTNDATALASGAALTAATLRWDRGRVGLWLPLTIAVLTVALEATSLAVVLAACAFVVVRAVQRNTSATERWRAVRSPRIMLFVGSLGIASVAVGVGWSAIAKSRATMDALLIPQNVPMAVHHFDIGWLATALPALITPLAPEFYQSVLSTTASAVIVGSLVHFGLLVLAIVGAVRSEPGSALRALAVALGVAALTFGPIFTVLQYVESSMQFPIPARYGLSLVPGLLVVAGTAVRTRRGAWALLVVGAFFYLLIARKLLG